MPYAHEIRVTWGDCDPARIVYTARIPWFALDAINAWWEGHLGQGWFQLELDRNVGTPFMHMSLDFRAPVTPRHRLICEVAPTRLGTSSIAFRVNGLQNGTLCFEGRFVCVFTVANEFRKRAAPDDIRALVEPLLEPDEA
ncbi:acyl-CoA thioesterase [Ovoidimarina sediminis]|uniref:acyl-CoA thioesterase n=1 Tax=Ovoidimarina sediminis TaxID=3079856 RepID=UPI002907D2AB|nr:thioesterase family protein [Rhodophyticola sp. MJ-SS7]MDU8943137.1 thioesterase family protein [Rhodophyticola sp. MJ-SS7]